MSMNQGSPRLTTTSKTLTSPNQTLTEPSLCLLSLTQTSNLIMVLCPSEPGSKLYATSLAQLFTQHVPTDTRYAAAVESAPTPALETQPMIMVPWPSQDMRDS